MALITVEELREEAALPNRNIDLTDYSDNVLQRKINWATAEIQRRSNRYFTPTTKTQSEISFFGCSIFLQHTPIQSITSFKIDGGDVDADYYILHPETGQLEFTNDEPFLFDFEVTYVVCEDPEGDIYLEAQDICLELVLAKIQAPADGQDIKNFKDGDFSVQYEEDDPMTEIEQRIDKLSLKKWEVIEG